ncbi:hypothetical protein [Aneurinibacillus sp. REN35]|uniref:hypothetical protein n=1 Tax=Aneurinibacillus sp. REN35 TaxID=3237286 RepID=UPI0035274922
MMNCFERLIELAELEGIAVCMDHRFPDGFIVFDNTDVYIALKAGMEMGRTEFILGHELGHYFLEHNFRKTKADKAFEVRGSSVFANENFEAEANLFSKMIIQIGRCRDITKEDVETIKESILRNIHLH